MLILRTGARISGRLPCRMIVSILLRDLMGAFTDRLEGYRICAIYHTDKCQDPKNYQQAFPKRYEVAVLVRSHGDLVTGTHYPRA
jgi:hypothetical protein